MQSEREVATWTPAAPSGRISKSGPGARLGLQDLWGLVKRNFFSLFLFVALGMTIVTALVFSMQERYSATAVIVLEPGNTAFDTVSARLRAVDPSVAQTEVEVLRSRQFAESIAERMALFQDESFVPSLDEDVSIFSRLFRILQLGWHNTFGEVEALGGTTPAPEALATNQSETEAANAADETEVLSEAELIAQNEALLREAVIDKLLGIYSVRYPGQGLAIRIQSTHADPDFAARVSNVVARTYIEEGLRRQRAGIDNAIEFLRERSVVAIGQLTTRQAELAALIRLNALDDSNRTEAMLAELESLRAIADLEGQGDASEISRQIEQRTAALRQRTQAELERAQLELALEIDQQRYQSISERLSEYEAQRDSLTPTARHITVAQPPREPSEPRRNVALAVAFVVLCCFAFIFVLFREQLDTRIWTAASTEMASGLPHLGTIPPLPRAGITASDGLLTHLSEAPYSPFGRAARSLIVSASAKVDTDKCVTLMVLSGLPNEGKSTVSVALSVCAAQDGLRVLLVDLDIRDWGASRMLKVPTSKRTFQSAIHDFEVFKTEIRTCPNHWDLDVINFGPQSHFGSKLWANRDEEARVEDYVRSTYDLVVIDTPSYQMFEDANRLAEFADAGVLLARCGQTKEESLSETSDAMLFNKIPLVGSALNVVDKRYAKRSSSRPYPGSQGHKNEFPV
ncbi:MAG: AAA family ATPase [Dinoroseobacter sp.]|nr:AAA family ATPase [Dinoroseobacter sp.]